MAKDYTAPISDSLSKSIVADLYGEAKRWFAKIDPGGLKLKDYRNGILNAFGHVQIMGMPSARKLENIYVGLRAVPDMKKYTRRVHILKWKPQEEKSIVQARKFFYGRQKFDVDKFISELGYDDIESQQAIGVTHREVDENEVDDIELEQNGDADSANARSLRALDFVTKYNKLVVLGPPGSGKTTFLKYLTLVFSGYLPVSTGVDYLLPVLVPLREVKRIGAPSPTADWLRDLAVSCATDVSTKPFAKQWLEDALANGKCLILLDGVDEAPAPLLSTIFQSIKAFSSKYRDNSIVITCRAASFDRSIEGFQICEIDDFNRSDIEMFVEQWYGSESAEAARLINDISNSNSALDLCKTPLLLTLICVLYGYRRTIPANRAELYEACVDALLFRWDTFRSVDRDPLVNVPLGPVRKKLLLARVAYRAFARDLIYFKSDLLCELIQAELNYLDLGSVSADLLLKEIESHSGLLIEYSPGVYCFSHLTFHEFFTALYYHDTKEYADLFNKVIYEPRYLEVFLMCIEKVYNADAFVIQIISHVTNVCLNKNTYDEYLHLLIKWILACDVAMNYKLRRVLTEIEIRLEQLDIGDESIISTKTLRSGPDEQA